jgi:hypothetical protein
MRLAVVCADLCGWSAWEFECIKIKKVIVVMPAYNAAQTLRKTYDEVMAQGIVDLVVLVDGGHDRDEIMLHAVFQILVDFVEQEAHLSCPLVTVNVICIEKFHVFILDFIISVN